MGRFQNSWEITKESWAVLRSNPSLAIFPVLSGLATALVSASFIIPFFVLVIGTDVLSKNPGHREQSFSQPLFYVLGFVFYALTYFVIIFFNSALVTCAHRNLTGQTSTVQDGIQNAVRHLPQIIGWTLISATVGQIIRALQQRGGLIGSLVGGLAGLAWSLAVFFVVPLMVLENVGPIDAVKGSAERLKRTWGEQLILNGGMGLASFLFVAAPAVAAMVLGIVMATSHMVISGITVIILGVLYMLAGSVVTSAMTVIYQTALYMYSTTGAIPTWYSQNSIQAAFMPKRARRL